MTGKIVNVEGAYTTSSYIVLAVTVIAAIIGTGICCYIAQGWLDKLLICVGGIVGGYLSVLVTQSIHVLIWVCVVMVAQHTGFDFRLGEFDDAGDVSDYDEI